MKRFMRWALALVLAAFAVACARLMTLDESIAACNFRYVDHEINARNFPSAAGSSADVSDMLTVSQADLGVGDMTTAEIESAIGRKGWRPATLAELLAYAKSKWNGTDTIALGSSWVDSRGGRYVPYLYEVVDDGTYVFKVDVGRKLNLCRSNPGDRWRKHDRFLVVRKKS
jgi:hypothetical protein